MLLSWGELPRYVKQLARDLWKVLDSLLTLLVVLLLPFLVWLAPLLAWRLRRDHEMQRAEMEKAREEWLESVLNKRRAQGPAVDKEDEA